MVDDNSTGHQLIAAEAGWALRAADHETTYARPYLGFESSSQRKLGMRLHSVRTVVTELAFDQIPTASVLLVIGLNTIIVTASDHGPGTATFTIDRTE